MTTISAKTILRSRNAAAPDKVLSSLLLRYPRWIHAEGRTHRLLEIFEGFAIEAYTPSLMDCDELSRNAASSRAIPVSKLIQDVLDDPAIPLHWGKNQKGMQADEEHHAPIVLDVGSDNIDGKPWIVERDQAWLMMMDDILEWARRWDAAGYHKQIVNRIIEPFSHITVLVSGTEWNNFLALRDHKDAEPHIAMLAHEVRKCLEDKSTIQTLQPGEWHLPFVNREDWEGSDLYTKGKTDAEILDGFRKLSVARCASTSYKTVDGFDMTLERAIALHDRLVASAPLHASPAEHIAQADAFVFEAWQNPDQHANFIGFRQYRKMLPGEYVAG